jgi:hypothetical protein
MTPLLVLEEMIISMAAKVLIISSVELAMIP